MRKKRTTNFCRIEEANDERFFEVDVQITEFAVLKVKAKSEEDALDEVRLMEQSSMRPSQSFLSTIKVLANPVGISEAE